MITKVTLRQKGIKNSMESLYLDFYPPIKNIQVNKDTRREFLRLYIFQNPKSPIEKKHNAETKKIAESIRQQRENILNKPEIYSDSEKETLKHIEIQKSSFIDYLEKCFNPSYSRVF